MKEQDLPEALFKLRNFVCAHLVTAPAINVWQESMPKQERELFAGKAK